MLTTRKPVNVLEALLQGLPEALLQRNVNDFDDDDEGDEDEQDAEDGDDWTR